MAHIRIFLSTVSNEFRTYRDRLAEKLKRPNLSVHVQEDFIAAGTETLDKLDDYIRECEAVIHIVGDMTGAMASPRAVAAIKERYPDLVTRFPQLAETLSSTTQLSYTQWEAFLALYHRKIMIIATPAEIQRIGRSMPRAQHSRPIYRGSRAAIDIPRSVSRMPTT
jgi:hypothetical protein